MSFQRYNSWAYLIWSAGPFVLTQKSNELKKKKNFFERVCNCLHLIYSQQKNSRKTKTYLAVVGIGSTSTPTSRKTMREKRKEVAILAVLADGGGGGGGQDQKTFCS